MTERALIFLSKKFNVVPIEESAWKEKCKEEYMTVNAYRY
jgi:hypothetical protein